MADRQVPGLRARITLDTTDLDRGEKRLIQFGRGTLTAFTPTRAGAVGLGLAFAGLTKEVITAGVAYQDSLNTFQAVTHATAQQMAAASQVAQQLGNDVKLPGVSAADAATAMTELSKAGLSVKDSLDGARGVLELATAGGLDVADAAKIAADALNEFGLAGKESTRVADLLAGAANQSAGEVGDFGAALNQTGLVAQQAGLSINQTVGALALFAQKGLQGQDAGTSFKTALLRLTAPTQQAADKIKALGLNLQDANGNQADFINIVQQLHDKLGGLSEAQRNADLFQIFGQDAIRVGEILTDVGGSALQNYINGVSRSGQAADITAAKSKGLGGALRNLSNEAEGLGLKGFLAVQKPLEAIINDASTGLVVVGKGASLLGDALHVVGSNKEALEGVAIALASIGAAKGLSFAAAALGSLNARLTTMRAESDGVGAALRGVFSPANVAAAGIGLVGATLLHFKDQADKARAAGKAYADSLIRDLDLSKLNTTAAITATQLTNIGDASKNLRTQLKDLSDSAVGDIIGSIRPGDTFAKAFGLDFASQDVNNFNQFREKVVAGYQVTADASGRLTEKSRALLEVLKDLPGTTGASGEKVKELAAKLLASDDVYTKITANINELSRTFGVSGDQAKALADKYAIVLDGTGADVVTQVNNLKGDRSSGVAGLGAAAEFAATQLNDFTTALNTALGKPADKLQATLDFQKSLLDLTQSVKDNGAVLDSGNAKSIQFQEDVLNAAKAGQQAAIANGKDSDDIAKRLQANEVVIKNTLIAAGAAPSVVQKVLSSIGETKAQISDVLKQIALDASGQGQQAGSNYAQGFADSLDRIKATVVAKAADLGHSALAATRGAIEAHSPSEATKRLGLFFGQGFEVGISDSKDRVAAASRALGKLAVGELGKAFDAQAKAQDAAKAAAEALAKAPTKGAAHTAAKKVYDDATSAVKKTTKALKDAEQATKDLDKALRVTNTTAASTKALLASSLKTAQGTTASAIATLAGGVSPADLAAAQARANATPADQARTQLQTDLQTLQSAEAAASTAQTRLAKAKSSLDTALKKNTGVKDAQKAFDAAVSAAKDAGDQLKTAQDAVTSSQAGLADAIVAQQAQQQQDLVDGLQKNLQAVADQEKTLTDSFAQGIRSGADLGSLFQQDGEGAIRSLDDVISDLQNRVNAGTTFAKDLLTLQSKGASALEISQISGLGAGEGDAIAQALLNDPSRASQLDGLLGQLDTLATHGADQLARQAYVDARTTITIQSLDSTTLAQLEQLLDTRDQQLLGLVNQGVS